jgi:hypothetical protein
MWEDGEKKRSREAFPSFLKYISDSRVSVLLRHVRSIMFWRRETVSGSSSCCAWHSAGPPSVGVLTTVLRLHTLCRPKRICVNWSATLSTHLPQYQWLNSSPNTRLLCFKRSA